MGKILLDKESFKVFFQQLIRPLRYLLMNAKFFIRLYNIVQKIIKCSDFSNNQSSCEQSSLHCYYQNTQCLPIVFDSDCHLLEGELNCLTAPCVWNGEDCIRYDETDCLLLDKKKCRYNSNCYYDTNRSFCRYLRSCSDYMDA